MFLHHESSPDVGAIALGCLLPSKLEQSLPKGANSCLENLELIFPGTWAMLLKSPESRGAGISGQRKRCESQLCHSIPKTGQVFIFGLHSLAALWGTHALFAGY